MLQTDTLRDYLSVSQNNHVVLTDFAAMESYKEDTLNSIFKAMMVVSKYPHQVIVLKNTNKIVGLRGKKAGLQRRMIDESQTKGFPIFARQLSAAQNGNKSYKQDLLDHGKSATDHLTQMLKSAEKMGPAYADLAKVFSSEEKRAIRDGATRHSFAWQFSLCAISWPFLLSLA